MNVLGLDLGLLLSVGHGARTEASVECERCGWKQSKEPVEGSVPAKSLCIPPMAARTDRTASSLRPLAISQSVLARVDGSTKFSFGEPSLSSRSASSSSRVWTLAGNVSVLGSVTGPAEVRIAKELVDRATLEINVRPLRGLAGEFKCVTCAPAQLTASRDRTGPASKAAESNLVSLLTPLILLHLYPRSLIHLTLQTLCTPTTAFSTAFSTGISDLSPPSAAQSNRPLGSAFAGAAESAARINAAMLALVDAGVACRGMLVAVAVAFVEGEMRLDPTPREEELAASKHVFAFSFGVGVGGVEGVCVGIDSVGQFDEDEVGFPRLSWPSSALTSRLLTALRCARHSTNGMPSYSRLRPQEHRGAVWSDWSTTAGRGQARAKADIRCRLEGRG